MTALIKSTQVTILSGQAQPSAGTPLGKGTLIGILIPSGWTTANLTFQNSIDDSALSDVYDGSGTELTVTVGGASRYIALDPTYFVGLSNIKIRSGTTGTPVNQGADRVLTLITKEY